MQVAALDFESSWIRTALLRVVVAKILVLTLVFDPGGLQAFDFPKSLLSRALEWVLLGLLLLAVLRFGIAILPRTGLHVAVTAYAVAFVLSAAFAPNTYVALFGEQDSYQGLTFLGDMLVLYVACAVVYRRLSDFRALVFAMVGGALVAASYAAIQFSGLDPLRWARDPALRPFSTFGNANQLAHYLSIASGLVLGLVLVDARAGARVAMLGVVGLFLLVDGFTGTRASVVGLGAALVAALAVTARLAGVRPFLRTAAPALVAVGVLAGVLALSPTGQRFIAGPLVDRLSLYEIAARSWVDRPLVGYGPDHFSVAFDGHRPPTPVLGISEDERHLWAHNFVLQALVTTGVLGAGSLLLIAGAGTWMLWGRISREPRTAVPLLIAWTAYWAEALLTISSVSVDWFPWLALGLTASLCGTRDFPPRRRALTPLGRAAIVLGACLGAVTIVPALRANHEAGAIRAAVLQGRPQLAVPAAQSVIELDSGRADYWNWLGLAYEASERWSDATSAYAAATQRASQTPVYWANLSRAAAARATLAGGGAASRAEALAAIDRALAIAPHDSVVLRGVADSQLLLNDCDAALASMLKAYVLASGKEAYIADADQAAECAFDLDGARARVTEAVPTRESAIIYATRALIESRRGDTAKARADATRALELDPSNRIANRVLDALGPEV